MVLGCDSLFSSTYSPEEEHSFACKGHDLSLEEKETKRNRMSDILIPQAVRAGEENTVK